MGCPRCGGNRPSRPTPPPSVVGSGRPGGAIHPARSNGQQQSPSVRDAITGLKYVPTSGNQG